MRRVLAPSNIPLNYWDKGAKYSSMLINLLPSRSLQWDSPVHVHHKTPSWLLVFLGYEPFLDVCRFLDPQKRSITISRNYSVPGYQFPYNSSDALKKAPQSLPVAVRQDAPGVADKRVNIHLPVDNHRHASLPLSNSPSQPNLPTSPPPPCSSPSPPPVTATPASGTVHPCEQRPKKGYAYVPHYLVAPRNIDGNITPSAILTTSRQGAVAAPPLLDNNNDETNLAEVVSVAQALADPVERPKWLASMSEENLSFLKRNTGTLVPPPTDDKVTGGMWCLVRKKNKFGAITRHKSRWVCFGNHQEHNCHYFDTYSSVGRNESLKVVLSMAVQLDLTVFQFDVETAFLYSNINAKVHVAQVSGFEVPCKENWVWRLNKSLYRTKQGPRCWKKHLTATQRPWLAILQKQWFHLPQPRYNNVPPRSHG